MPQPAITRTSHTVRRLAAAAMVLSLASCASVVAHERTPAGVALEIFDRTEGRVLPMYTHEGRRYVVGKPGNEYTIKVINARGDRVLAVMSVDGVNVITGDTASPRQSGYVFGAGESGEIAGWRKNMANTAAFYFTSLPNAYATRTGRPDNVGVVGVAIFRERERPKIALAVPQPAVPFRGDTPASAAPPPSREGALNEAPRAADAAGAGRYEERSKLGTGHGRIESSQASYTAFERASAQPDETIAIYYDSYANLLALGVPVGSPPIARLQPEPFPERGRFAPDPR